MATSFTKFTNRAASSLDGGIDTSDPVTLNVQSGDGALFPATGDFYITIEEEILKCTSRSTDALTCSRAQEGTANVSHADGTPLFHAITAAAMTEIATAINAIEDAIDALEASGPTKGFTKSVAYTDGAYGSWDPGQAFASIAQNKYATFNFYVPHDFTTITEAVIVAHRGITAENLDIDLDATYGAAGEDKHNHNETDAASVYTLVGGKLTEIDVSGVLTGIAAGDYVGLTIENKEVAAIQIVEFRFRYT